MTRSLGLLTKPTQQNPNLKLLRKLKIRQQRFAWWQRHQQLCCSKRRLEPEQGVRTKCKKRPFYSGLTSEQGKLRRSTTRRSKLPLRSSDVQSGFASKCCASDICLKRLALLLAEPTTPPSLLQMQPNKHQYVYIQQTRSTLKVKFILPNTKNDLFQANQAQCVAQIKSPSLKL